MTGKDEPKPSTKRVTGRPPTQTLPAAAKTPSQVIKRQTQRLKAAEPQIEVVSSSDQQEEEHRARRAHVAASAAGGGNLRGLSLRWKIMAALAGVTLLAAVLIFFVVYNRSVEQLNREIDGKGARLVNTLASIDSDYWMYTIHQDPMERRDKFDLLMQDVYSDWSDTKRRDNFFSKDPNKGTDAALRAQYDRLFSRLGAEKLESGKAFLRRVRDAAVREWEATDPPNIVESKKAKLDAAIDRSLADPRWSKQLAKVLDPLGEAMSPLKALKDEAAGDIVQMSVGDVTESESSPATVSVRAGTMKFSYDSSSSRSISGIDIVDGIAREEGVADVPARAFTRTIDHGGSKLRYYVLLSIDHINSAKGALRTMMFLTTVASVLIGLAIAWWLSQRITEPVKVLISDIDRVSGGDLDHKTIAHSSDEIGMLAETFNRMTQALKAAHEQEMEAKAMEHELGIAAEIQANLVPKRMLKVPGYDISAYYRPSKEVGGDYYDFIDIDENHSGLIVADVSGKGVPGSLVMSMTRALIRMEAERFKNNSPAQTLVHVNRMLAQDIKKGMFVTAIYVVLDKTTNRIAVASAGHNPMLLIKGKGQIVKVNPKGIALGFDKGPVFERTISEETIQLEKGDRIVMYTDGTVEAMNEASEEFSDEKFEALSSQLSGRDSNQFLNLIVKALDEHKGDAPQHDDQTIVTMRYTGQTAV